MTKRKGRLKRGIISLEVQKELHEQKLEETKKAGNKDLEKYYIKEIKGFAEEREHKLSKLHRKDKNYKNERDISEEENVDKLNEEDE